MDYSVSGKRIQIYESLMAADEAAEGGVPDESPYGQPEDK